MPIASRASATLELRHAAALRFLLLMRTNKKLFTEALEVTNARVTALPKPQLRGDCRIFFRLRENRIRNACRFFQSLSLNL